MKSEIISSQSPLRRYPILAFALSFIFTGLGQVYNGHFSKGFVFLIFRVLSLLVLPFYVIIYAYHVSVLFLSIIVIVQFIIWILSPVEAAYSARSQNTFNLKNFNSIFIYFIYGLISSGLLIFSVLLIISFFSIETVSTENMNPALLKNEYVVVNKYSGKNVGVGDAVIFVSKNGKAAGRIIAKDGDLVSKKGGYYINNTALPRTIISKIDLEKNGIDNSEDLFFELNGERKYPVKMKQDKSKNASVLKPVLLGNDEYLIAFDNRSTNDSFEIVKQSAITGKIEGILFSKKIRRIFNKLYLKAE